MENYIVLRDTAVIWGAQMSTQWKEKNRFRYLSVINTSYNKYTIYEIIIYERTIRIYILKVAIKTLSECLYDIRYNILLLLVRVI